MQRPSVRVRSTPGSPLGTGFIVAGSTTFIPVKPGIGRPTSRVVGCRSPLAASALRVSSRKVMGPVSDWPQPWSQAGKRRLLACRKRRTVGGWMASKVLTYSRTSAYNSGRFSASSCQPMYVAGSASR